MVPMAPSKTRTRSLSAVRKSRSMRPSVADRTDPPPRRPQGLRHPRSMWGELAPPTAPQERLCLGCPRILSPTLHRHGKYAWTMREVSDPAFPPSGPDRQATTEPEAPTVPVLLLGAARSGLLEEVIVCGYLLRRLDQLGWSKGRALWASALLRGAYHLYQGYGGFAGNVVLGLFFGRVYQRRGRTTPLVIAHFLIDAVAGLGYLALRGKVSWLPR